MVDQVVYEAAPELGAAFFDENHFNTYIGKHNLPMYVLKTQIARGI